MGIMDTIKEKVMGGTHEGQAMQMITQLVSSSGGFSGLIEKFTAAGFGDTVKSWLSSGKKLPITPEQIQKVVGSSQLQTLGTKFGLNASQVSTELSAKLPELLGQFASSGTGQKVEEMKNKISDIKH